MKLHKFTYAVAALAVGIGMTACSSDYLDVAPEVNLPYDEVTDNLQGAQLAVHGMCQSMYQQYSALYDYNWFNGEPWLSMYYGDVMGQDYISLFWFRGYPGTVMWRDMLSHGSYGSTIAWSYCYGIIMQANNILAGVAADEEAAGELAFRRAQALTMRAHCYTRLMQIYAPRWEDSERGEKLTVPLRLMPGDPEGTTACPLATMNRVFEQIYADLDDAIDCYKRSGMDREYNWEPGIDIARGIYARAAMIKHDWATAQEMARTARQNYPIMTAEEYLQGFADPNAEWMWTNSDNSAGIYFASFGATYACNGAYPCRWGSIGAGAINYTLYKELEVRDQRRQLYFTPDKAGVGVMVENFWNTSNCNSSTLDINSTSSAISPKFREFALKKYDEIGRKNGWDRPYTMVGLPAEMADNYTGYGITAQFGAQFKFWGKDGYSSSFFPFMRGSEMLLIEAEAACMRYDDETARKCLTELQEKRITRYRPGTDGGDVLLEEIKLARRAELWGEGFNWFDYKRWNSPIVRDMWVAKDVNSGNWPPSVATIFQVDDANGWRWGIPSSEIQYNDDLSMNELDF